MADSASELAIAKVRLGQIIHSNGEGKALVEEIERLRARVSQLEKEASDNFKAGMGYQIEAGRLTAENQRLRADSARMDFLEQLDDWSVLSDQIFEGQQIKWWQTIRAAIDAARAEAVENSDAVESKHVCGLQGFNGMIDYCPACRPIVKCPTCGTTNTAPSVPGGTLWRCSCGKVFDRTKGTT